MNYRAHIDGLRAVAVLSVVLYHLGMPLHGGFVGVDIFFTISGFLIGSLIIRETASGSFTFAGFYERRIRRIVPALLAMLAGTLILSRYMFPGESVAFAKSMLAALTSTSNFYFWSTSGYFEAPSHELPLLHTWSLAVEEQFYIFLPICLVLIHRFQKKLVGPVLCMLALASFILSAYGAFHFTSATFYLPHTRAWELLLGTLIAFEGFPKVRNDLARNLCGLLGLALIVVPLLYYSDLTPFPGLAALPPCLGTALIIVSGESGDNLVCRFLAVRPAVFIGLISYSLYLWHWPLMVFRGLGFTVINGLNRHESQALLLALSLLAAVVSWRFVETPFRRHSLCKSRTALFSGASVATLVASAAALVIIVSRGLPDRFPAQAIAIAEWGDHSSNEDVEQYRTGTCFITNETATLADFNAATCLSAQPARRSVLILGDSHAAHLWWGMQQTHRDVNVMQATATGCKPVLNQRPRQQAGCSAIMDFVFRNFFVTHQWGRDDSVLLVAAWNDGDLPSLSETLAWLNERHVPVTLVGPIVQYDSALPRLLAMSITQDNPALPQQHRAAFVEPLDQQMRMLAGKLHVPYVSMYKLLCPEESCIEFAQPGIPLQKDYGHLTKAGSVLAAERLAALGTIPTGFSKVAQ